jgi:glucose/arabinose dehydrogenase
MPALKLLLKYSLIGIATLVLLLGGLVLFMPGIHISSLGMILNVMTGASADTPEDELLNRLQTTDGYRVSVFARGVANPRLLHLSRGGLLLVSSPRSGEIVRLEDTDGDGAADSSSALLSGLKRPHGLTVYQGWLYVAESHQVGRIAYDSVTGTTSGDYEVVVTELTDDGNHWSKTIRFGADGKLYVAMGSTCNVCEELDQRRATIMRYNADGSNGEIFASGLRNSVGFAFAPWDGALYATDNGRDLLGDDYPPCELNRVEQGGFYGWPYLNGNNELDPDFGADKQALVATAIPPAFPFPAHNAPLGIHFPERSGKSALVALHGSWNRSIPDGYKVVKLQWHEDGSISSSDFMWGFEVDADIIGRPVDITSDGAGGLFISDDYARVIYRLSRRDDLSSSSAAAAPRATMAADANIDPELARAGEALYWELPCAECHAPESMTPVVLMGLGEKYDIESLSDYFLTPTPPMPRYELDGLQRRQLASYLLMRERTAAGK